MNQNLKLTFKTAMLQKATKELSPLAGSSFNPNLKNFLIEVNAPRNWVKFTARDDNTQSSIKITKDVQVEDLLGQSPKEGEEGFFESYVFALDAKKFSSLVSQLSSEEIILKVTPNTCKIQAGKGKYSFELLSGQDFSLIQPKLPECMTIHSKTDRFVEGLSFASFSLTKANKNIDSNLEAIKFYINPVLFRVSSTDRFRFSYFEDQNPPKQDDAQWAKEKEKSFCLSSSGADYLVNKFLNFSEVTEDFYFDIIDGKIFYSGFYLPDYEKEIFISLLDSTTYPDLVKKIGDEFKDSKGQFKHDFLIEIDKKELNKALSRMSLMVDERNHQIVLTAKWDKFLMKVQSREFSGTKSADEEVLFEKITCNRSGTEEKRYEDMISSVGVNCGFLVDAMKFFDSEKINLLILGENKPIVLYGDNVQEKYLLIMNQQI